MRTPTAWRAPPVRPMPAEAHYGMQTRALEHFTIHPPAAIVAMLGIAALAVALIARYVNAGLKA